MPIAWHDEPELVNPALVAAFEGWNDAADAASDALRFLIRAFDAQEVATLDAGEFVDFQANRPLVEIVNGVLRTVTLPVTRVRVARADRDLVLVLGHEPNFHWRGYCREILDIAARLGCDTVVSLGALLADAPHSRPIRITGTASDPEVSARLGMMPSTYEGPTGIVGTLHAACRDAGTPSFSLWAPVPHYAATPPSPKATRALLDRLSALLGVTLDLGRLDVAAEAWERQVGELVRGDDEVAAYVRRLEEQHDISIDVSAESNDSADETDDSDDSDDLPSGDTLAADFQRYLRDQE